MSLQTRLNDLITAIGTDYKQFRTWLTGSNTGTLSALTTTSTNIVGAINEVKAVVDTPDPIASTTNTGWVELATLAEVTAGIDTARAVTSEGVRQERIALREEILGSGVPEALDTLDELAAALGDDANFAATITTALANRVRVDTNAQNLTVEEMQNARTNIAAVYTGDIGDPDADLVGLYTLAKS